MSYKDMIIEILDKINDETILRILYRYAVAGLNEEREKT